MIEFRNACACGPVPEMEVTRHQTLRDERFNEAEAIDHLERGRMGCGRSWTVIHFGLGFEKRHDETVLSARERGNNANGARAGNDDAWSLHLIDGCALSRLHSQPLISLADLAEIVKNSILHDTDFFHRRRSVSAATDKSRYGIGHD